MAKKKEGRKYDKDKPNMFLVMEDLPRALLAVGQVLTFGANKYAEHDWLNVENGIQRFSAAAVRHRLARAKGEEYDSESKLLHAAHETTNVLFVLELLLRAKEAGSEVKFEDVQILEEDVDDLCKLFKVHPSEVKSEYQKSLEAFLENIGRG